MTKPNQTTFPIVSDHDIAIDFEGLTKREYFAAHAPIAIEDVFSFLERGGTTGEATVGQITKLAAEFSVGYADALIAELNTPTQHE